MRRSALITGITGQDGSYLAELLLTKGYEVHGLVRQDGRESLDRIDHVLDQITVHNGCLSDQANLTRIVRRTRPNEIYNLAAQTFIPASWETPIGTTDVTALGVVRVLESARTVDKSIRVFQAGSSEMFGRVETSPQNETTAFRPATRTRHRKCMVTGSPETTVSSMACTLVAASCSIMNPLVAAPIS